MSESSLTIFDGNNWLRRKYAEDRDTSALRACVMDVRNELARKNNAVLFVWDGFSCNKYRREIYAPYKTNRGDIPDGFRDQLKAFKQILENMHIIILEIPEFEADDLIAAAVIGLRDKFDTIHIKSTDKDFHQLGVSYEGAELPIPPEETILYKVLVGDQSDKIAGVPGLGKIKYEKLDKTSALSWLDADFDVHLIPDSMPEAQRLWCEQNRDTLIAMRDVCRFREVPEHLLEEHGKFGKDNPAEVERILKEYMA